MHGQKNIKITHCLKFCTMFFSFQYKEGRVDKIDKLLIQDVCK